MFWMRKINYKKKTMSKINFIDLQSQRKFLGNRIDNAIQNVLDHGQFILGPEVQQLEENLAHFCGAKDVVSCANGTDALTLALMCEEIGPGDLVFVPNFTFVATAETVAQLGGTVFFVDVEAETFNINPKSLEQAYRDAQKLDLCPKAIIAVDLFGQPADYTILQSFARKHNLVLIDDAAQSFGASIESQCVGNFADYTTTSFFPAKPLGCYGDGGAVIVHDPEKANLLRSMRFHGKGDDKYNNVRVGLNSRLDTIQAAILIEKLKIFSDEIKKRNEIAAFYSDALKSSVETPKIKPGFTSTWAQYTVKLDKREAVQSLCQNKGIPTAVYYPTPLNKMSGYNHFPTSQQAESICQNLCERVLSLPMHPYLTLENLKYITEQVLIAVETVQNQGS